jgi:hypothetical protein
MTIATVSFDLLGTAMILLMTHRLQMIGIDAMAHPTEVVNLQAVSNRAIGQLVGHAMST